MYSSFLLFWTTTFSRPERVKVLLAAGAHVNLRNNNGRTPLDNALAEGYGSDEARAEMVELPEAAGGLRAAQLPNSNNNNA